MTPSGGYGYEACAAFWGNQSKTDQGTATAQELAKVWMMATGDLKGGKNGAVDGCMHDPDSCYDTCVSAITQAIGECQATDVFMSEKVGSCKINDVGGGVWQVSNYDTDLVKDSDPHCQTLPSLVSPCCAARAAFSHATWYCTSTRFDDGPLNGTLIPDCPRYEGEAQVWGELNIKGSPAHRACWNGLFCTDANDGDWLNGGQDAPNPSCGSYRTPEDCGNFTTDTPCVWEPTHKRCIGGFAGWEDSWSKYAYARCCDTFYGCAAPNLSTQYGCFDLKKPDDYFSCQAFALAENTTGMGMSYLEIAKAACKAAGSEVGAW
jgi:hypothetical protein